MLIKTSMLVCVCVRCGEAKMKLSPRGRLIWEGGEVCHRGGVGGYLYSQ